MEITKISYQNMESWGWGEGSVRKCLLKYENLSWNPNMPQTTGPW